MRWLHNTLAALAILGIAYACKIPVFRYALERWKTDEYRLKIVIPEGSESKDYPVINEIKFETGKGGGVANLNLEVTSGNVAAATYELLYPEKSGIFREVSKGSLSELKSAHLLNSPIQKKTKELILEGKSLIWIFVPGNDESANKAFKDSLAKRTAATLKTVKLSDGVIQKDDKRELDAKESENKLHSDIPLELSFEVLTLNRTDSKEKIFLKMLSRQSPQLVDHQGPFAVPVFGRGRILDGITDTADGGIEKLTLYLCGHCSCTIKDENPGIDILMNVDWQEHVSLTPLSTREVLPPVTGVIETTEKAQEKPEKVSPVTPKEQSSLIVTLLSTALFTGILLILGFIYFFRK